MNTMLLEQGLELSEFLRQSGHDEYAQTIDELLKAIFTEMDEDRLSLTDERAVETLAEVEHEE